ncbi:MAG: 23S rRNA (adenine(2503)-C(2))-methyltransferase RlmN [Clostridiaceae bacterium]|jgi:23S rRNA (adenine2503-C2)-methyltransferase|nr:23S rRNA (adenine(2503)-C(2))-methyltransferase RlmN [Clostridiaceae bacterium]
MTDPAETDPAGTVAGNQVDTGTGKLFLPDMDISELEEFFAGIGQKKYRAKQVFGWIAKGAVSFDEMTDLPLALREDLKLLARVSCLKIRKKFVSAVDGTVKYLFGLDDGNIIESVLMEYNHGYTACVSSQVGCKMGCSFCASTVAGFRRNLTAGEILEQVLAIQRDSGVRVSNVVVMGIGEPFDNYDNVIKFLRLANSHHGLNIGYRHMTVSTCGIVPGILRFAGEGFQVNLAVSLHAPNDRIRAKLMPVGRKYRIDKIIEASKIYTEKTNRRIMFEYALIEGVNDLPENAVELAFLLKGLLCLVNLIPVNPVDETSYRQSGRKRTERFAAILKENGIETTVRRELGSDINAACGQLRLREMSARGSPEREQETGTGTAKG